MFTEGLKNSILKHVTSKFETGYYSTTLSQVTFLRTRFHLPRYLGNISQINFHSKSLGLSRSLGRDYASNADRGDQFDRYIHYAKVRWNAPMSGLGP